MNRRWTAGLLAAVTVCLTLLVPAGPALRAEPDEPATKPASEPSSQPAQEWKLPALNHVIYLVAADEKHAVIADKIPPKPLPPNQPPQYKWYLVDLKTGDTTDLAEFLGKIAKDFQGPIMEAQFSPDGKSVLIASGLGWRYIWLFDLAGKKGVNLSEPTGNSRCFWLGEKVIVTAKSGAGIVPMVPAKMLDQHRKAPVDGRLPGPVIAVNERATTWICTARGPAKTGKGFNVGYMVFTAQLQTGKPQLAKPMGYLGPLAPGTPPRFILSPSGRFCAAVWYAQQADAKEPSGLKWTATRTQVFNCTSGQAVQLEQVGFPVFVSDQGKAITSGFGADKGKIILWDAKGKQSQVLVEDSAASSASGNNLYYITKNADKWTLHAMANPKVITA